MPRNMPQQMVRSASSSSEYAACSRPQSSSSMARWSRAKRSANSAASRSRSLSPVALRQSVTSA